MIPIPQTQCVHWPQMWGAAWWLEKGDSHHHQEGTRHQAFVQCKRLPFPMYTAATLGMDGRKSCHAHVPHRTPWSCHRGHKQAKVTELLWATTTELPGAPFLVLLGDWQQGHRTEREGRYCPFPSEMNLPAALWWGAWWRRLEGVLHCLQLALGNRLFWERVHEMCLLTKAFTCGSYLLFCKGVILEWVT